MLPSNVDDPRFRADDAASHTGHAEWTAGSALHADLTDPIDQVMANVRSPDALLGLACRGLEMLGALLAAIVEHALHR